jgi:hypothetical protein
MTSKQKQRVAKWIEALRSCNFKQGRHKLKTVDRYCCLGVACEISGLGKWVHNNGQSSYINATYALPAKVQNYYGLDDYSGAYFDNGQLDHNLSSHNDEGMTFAEIADLIEGCLENPESKMFI